jgi:Tol biopolymer transport system component
MDDVSMRLTPDELTVVFSRRAGAGTGLYDLYIAKRASIDDPFDTPTLMSTVNSVNSDVWPAISPDGLLLVFESDRGATAGTYRPYASKRATTNDSFGPAAAISALMDGDEQPYLANAGALYFSSATRTPAPGARDIWRVAIDSTGTAATPAIVVGDVDTAAAELAPAVSPDELRIFFRRAAGSELDIYTASRTTTADPFGASSPVAALAMPAINEIPNWISPDGCALYVQLAGAPTTMGGDDLYVSLRGQ